MKSQQFKRGSKVRIIKLGRYDRKWLTRNQFSGKTGTVKKIGFYKGNRYSGTIDVDGIGLIHFEDANIETI